MIPELSSHEGFYLLQQEVENEIDDLVKETTSTNRKRKIVQIFDQMSDSICRVADMVFTTFIILMSMIVVSASSYLAFKLFC